MIDLCVVVGLYPQIRLLYGIKSEAAFSLTFDLHCKAIAALFHIAVLFEDIANKPVPSPIL